MDDVKLRDFFPFGFSSLYFFFHCSHRVHHQVEEPFSDLRRIGCSHCPIICMNQVNKLNYSKIGATFLKRLQVSAIEREEG